MLDPIAAELLKLRSHRAIWFLIWVYPIGFLAIFIAAVLLGTPPGAREWYDDTSVIWAVPRQAAGRYLIAAFVALAFAGEYDWNTWKLIVPHRARLTLMAAKYVVVLILLMTAFALTAAIALACAWGEDAMSGDRVLGGLGAAELARVHALSALAALPAILLTLAVASAAAILTRSMLAAMIIAMVVITFEQMIFTLGPRLSLFIPQTAWNMFHLLPGYHLANVKDWIFGVGPLQVPFPSGRIVAFGWGTSLTIVAAWTGAATILAMGAFRRQDIN